MLPCWSHADRGVVWRGIQPRGAHAPRQLPLTISASTTNVSKADRSLDDYVRAQAKQLKALSAAVGEELDLSYESLDRVEDFYRGVLDKTAALVDTATDRVTRYVGATLAKHTEGTWARSTEPGFTEPAIKVPGLARTFEPHGVVITFKRLQSPGRLRDETERWDLPLQRAALARLRANAKQEQAQLIDDVAQLTGQRIAKLDRSAKSLGLVEDALKALATGGASRARLREVRGRAVLMLGNLYARIVGGGEWEVESDPKMSTFGMFHIAYWSPADVVHRIGAKTSPGRLAKSFNFAVELAKEQRSRPREQRTRARKTVGSVGTWFVMCAREHALPIAKLKAQLASLRDAEVKRDGDALEITVHDRLTKRDAEITVGLSTESHVRIEAAEIAERKDRPEVAALDARYELLYDLRVSDPVYNTLCVVAGKLEKKCHGVIYDATAGRFV